MTVSRYTWKEAADRLTGYFVVSSTLVANLRSCVINTFADKEGDILHCRADEDDPANYCLLSRDLELLKQARP